MVEENKVETFIYEDLGFPIKLINVPMKKVFGEWAININLGQLQRDMLYLLVYKKFPLTNGELRFIRKYFELTTTAFGKIFGVTHAAVLKWESDKGRVPPTTEFCIRLFVLDRLRAKNEEFGRLYHKITIESLTHQRKAESSTQTLEYHANRKPLFA